MTAPMPSRQELARCIDHTQLKPDAPESAIRTLCAEARQYGFVSVCVQPIWVSVAAAELEDSGVLVGTVIGFPHGANVASVKTLEAEEALRQGADELDMVIAIGAAKSGAWSVIEDEIARVVEVASNAAEVKVILECAYLTDEEKRRATEIVAASGAAFVKTSTGFGPHGAMVADVRLLREVVGSRCSVKAAGGIRDLDTALAMLEAGANRLGTSAGVAILSAMP